jgi:hypothetical protein
LNGNITNSQISAGPNNTNITDGNDTIVIASGSTGTNSSIINFSKANDTLIIGTTTITGLSSLAAGSYTGSQYGATAGASLLLKAWLDNGGNKITLI